MRFVETSIFTKEVRDILPDDEYRALQTALMFRPEGPPAHTRKRRLTENTLGRQRERGSGAGTGSYITGISLLNPFICYWCIRKVSKKI